MSAFLGKVFLTVGLGVVAAVFYTFWSSNQHEQHGHRQQGNQRRYADSRRDSAWGLPPSWMDDDDMEIKKPTSEDDEKRRLRKRNAENKSNSTSTTVQGTCLICYETFEDLKRKEIPIWTTPCGHIFCRPCLTRSIQASPTRSCPSCRVRVNLENCHKIHI